MDVPAISSPDDVKTLIRRVGVDFDPFLPASHYRNPDGGPRFTAEQAARLDAAVAAAERVCEQAGADLGGLARRVVNELRHGPWPALDRLVVLLVGAPTDGFRHLGPFPTGDDVDAEHRELRGDYWWLASLEQLDLPPGQVLLHRVEVAMALLDDAVRLASGDDRPLLAGQLHQIGWRLRALQLELS